MIHPKYRINRKSMPVKKRWQPLPDKPNKVWQIALHKDPLWDGRSLKILTVQDEFNNQLLRIWSNTHLHELGIIFLLESLKKTSELPELVLIHESVGPLSLQVDIWCLKNKVRISFNKNSNTIRPPAMRARMFLHLLSYCSFKTMREAMLAAKGPGKYAKQNKLLKNSLRP